jgi:CheY-like chemotaxis protein
LRKGETMPVILIVDDNPSVRELLERLLTAARHTVWTASGGQEALEALQREAIDAVITDLDMPGMGGVELLKGLRQTRPFLPVIGISGHFDPGAAAQAGFDAFFPKPFNIADLLQALSGALEKRRTVLIVEDVPAMREVLRATVEQLGLRGIEAGNGAEALKVLEKEGADLVISDCSMPLCSGRRLLTEIGARFPDLRVVMVSASFRPEDVEAVKPFDFLCKPYRLDDLKRVVVRALS